ncbi:MAG: ABC transporter permease [Alphaproteobacteria bacterium]
MSQPPFVRNQAPHPGPTAIDIGLVNWRGLWTLYVKEVQRFFKVFTQTIAAPAVTTLMFYTIFSLALGGASRMIGDTPFIEFLAPGLIMMAMVQNSFANTSSSLMIAKIQGNIVDVLMPPLTAGELTVGFAAGGLTRGLIVGFATGLVLLIFVPIGLANPALILFHAFAASLMLALLGIIAGVWAQRFDHMAAVTNFIIMPFSFLSGTFYSIERLPDAWQIVARLNPFFYMIDGFRAGFIGRADADPLVGVGVMVVIDCVLFFAIYRMFASGYRLKA